MQYCISVTIRANVYVCTVLAILYLFYQNQLVQSALAVNTSLSVSKIIDCVTKPHAYLLLLFIICYSTSYYMNASLPIFSVSLQCLIVQNKKFSIFYAHGKASSRKGNLIDAHHNTIICNRSRVLFFDGCLRTQQNYLVIYPCIQIMVCFGHTIDSTHLSSPWYLTVQ